MKAAAIVACAMVLLLAAFTRPDLSRGHDEVLYLNAADGFVAHGLDFAYPREPLYPLILAGLKVCGIDPTKWMPLIQNLVFLGSLYFFLRSLFKNSQSCVESLLLAVVVTLIPTFLVPMNGSLYTESLSASLIFVMLGACTRLGGETSSGKTALMLALALLSSMALGLIKGAFVFIHVLFGALGIAWILFARWRPGQNLNGSRSIRKLFAALVLISVGSQAGSELWLCVQQSRSSEPLELYSRGGVVLYGRTEYARNFDFSKQSMPFLVCAVSISAYRKIYADDGYQYTFDAENTIGYNKLAEKSDAELFKLGIQNILNQPFRQGLFSLYELARFPIHHTNAGFATVQLAGVGTIFHSSAVAVLLKLFNAVLLLSIPVYLRRRGLKFIAERSTALDDPLVAGTALYLLYALAYLSVYSFASTIARMVYPIAPLLVVLNWQMLREWSSLKRRPR